MKTIKEIMKRVRLFILKKIKLKENERIIKNNKVVYCVIQRKREHYTEGLFACFLAVIKMIYKSKEKGMIPVIDMQTYKNPYLNENETGRINAWELFFNQPADVSLDQIKGKKNIIYMYEPPYNAFPNDTMDFLTNDAEIAFWRNFCRKNICFSDTVSEYIKRYGNLSDQIRKNKTVGVCLRGSDYMRMEPVNHAVVPDSFESIKKVKQVMDDYNCTSVFLAVEDIRILKAFKEEFGEKLLYIEQTRFSGAGKKALALTDEYLKSDVHEMGLKYLSAIYLVSQCTCLVAARCCGAIGALLLADDYEYTFFWNKGRYKLDHLNQSVKE